MTSTSMMKSRLKVLLPFVVIGLGLLGAAGMIAARPEVPTAAPVIQPPLIRVVTAERRNLQLKVRTQGTVRPRTESSLIPEVSGRVTWVSPSLAAGGFFEAGETLLRIDSRDYEVAVDRARAALQRTESEARLAETSLLRSRSLSKQGVTSDAELDEAENAARVANASRQEARSALEQAERDLARTEIRAPFAGRVRQEQVDVGQFLVRGTPVATLYAVDVAEIRLPVPDDQLAFVELPLVYRGESESREGPEVVVTARFAGRTHEWRGHVVRTEGEIDPRTRMVNVIAQIEDPYGRGKPGRPPLAVGLFVDAEILGRRVDDVVVLPREALRGTDQVLVVDDEDRLRFRTVEVLRHDHETAIVRSGLEDGERVSISPLEAVTDGMRVRVAESERSGTGGPEPARNPTG